ncbi:MAG: VWA domain-containing protein [Lachnospiraceae bacterium]|nr:VWA domain-containing protein [Lachnospiraceae bacterium]
MKKWIRMAVIAFMAVCMLAMNGICALADDSSSMDVVLVIDLSGSMKHTDPDKVSLDGACLFIDMMESTGSRAGVVAFSDELVQVYDLTEINSYADKEAIKNVISSLDFSGDTDIGTAIEKAVEMLTTASDVGNKKSIIFFTDGNIDLPNASAGEDAAEAESLQKAQNAISTASASGIPIYTIGLNANGNVDTELISTMSSSTGATSNVVTSASELPSIFNSIFANFVETEINELGDLTISSADTYEQVPFEIPNDSVLEANIVMITSDDTGSLTDILLTDPSGNTLSPDGSTIILSSSDNYHMLKIIGPSAGTWTLQVKGDQGCQVHVNLLFNYDVILTASGAEAADGSGSLIVTATLQKNGAVVSDDTLYAQLTTTANVTASDGTTASYPMTLSGTEFTCTVPVEAGEIVTVSVHTEGANMYRDSDAFQFQNSLEVEPETEPIVKGSSLPSTITIKGLIPSMAKTTLDLSDYFTVTNSSNSIAGYSASGADSSIVTTTVNGNELKLKGVSKGTTTMTVQATDAQGNTLDQSTQVVVSAVFGSILPLILIPVILIIIIVLVVILMLKSKGSKMVGYLFWQLQNDDGYSDSMNEEQYDLTFAKKKVQVNSFISDFALASAGLDKVVITGSKDGIVVQNKGKACALVDSNGSTVKKAKIFDGGSFRIACQTEDGDSVFAAIHYQRNLNDFDFE